MMLQLTAQQLVVPELVTPVSKQHDPPRSKGSSDATLGTHDLRVDPRSVNLSARSAVSVASICLNDSESQCD